MDQNSSFNDPKAPKGLERKPVELSSSDNIMQSRITTVYSWLCWMWPRHKMLEEGTKLFSVGPRQVDEYISMAKKLIYDREIIEDRKALLNESISGWEEFIERCRTNRDRKNETVGRKQIDKLKGLEITKMEITIPGLNVMVKPDELKNFEDNI